MRITVGSLFSGIGGIELGLERTDGFKTVWFIEKDQYCQAILRKHWSTIPIYGDIEELDFSILERPDMLAGGFPCQPTSTAGKRKGAEDSRWLWPEFARAIRILRPSIVLVENPPGILGFTREFGQVLSDLAESGYDAEWNRVSAASVGAPHLRERIFIVAYNDRSGFARPYVPVFTGTPRPSGINFGGSSAAMAHANESRWREKQSNIFSRQQDSQRSSIIPDSDSENLRNKHRRRDGASRKSSPLTGNDGPKEFVEKPPSGRERVSIFSGRTEGTRTLLEQSGWWATEPDMGRVAYGISNRVDRLRCLGNAVVPQVAEAIGRMILASRGVVTVQKVHPS